MKIPVLFLYDLTKGGSRLFLHPPEIIIKPYNIIFTDIVPDLHLDQLKRDKPGILQPVHGANRDERALPFTEEEFFAVNSHLRRPGDDDPVLAAVVVHLEREPFLGRDRDALDRIKLAVFEPGIRPPGAVDRGVNLSPLIVLLPQLFC